ncbi:MAG: HAMP domain-containing sensor histidine kinase [Elusimicrobiota bacterium]
MNPDLLYTGENFKALINAVSEGIVCINDKTEILIFNDAFTKIIATPPQKIFKTSFIKYFPGNEVFLSHILNLEKENLPATDIIMEQDFSIYSLCIYTAGITYGNLCKIITIRDITQSIKESERIKEDEKLSSISNLTSGMAHEMNNPLSGIGGFADLLIRKKSRFGLSGEAIEIIEAIKENASRAATILNDLLSFSRIQKNYTMDINLHELIIKIIKTQHLPRYITINHEFKAVTYFCQTDPERLKRAISILLLNSINNIRQIQIQKKQYNGLINVKTASDKDLFKIEIADNGMETPLSHIETVLDPFFSDKKSQPITTISLYRAKNLIANIGGTTIINSSFRKNSIQVSIPFKKPDDK